MRSTDYNRNDLQSVLTYMRNQFGAGVFEEPSRMVSILLDLAPGLKRDGNVLRQASEEGLMRELRQVSENGKDLDRARVVAKSRKWLADYLMLSEEKTDYFMTTLQAAYGLKIEPPKLPEPAQPVTPSAPQAQEDTRTPLQQWLDTLTPPKPEPPPTPQPPKPAIIDSGSTGDCTWTLDSNHILTISGHGRMDNYVYTPWNNYLTSIKGAVIESGVTSIGGNAFQYCLNLISVMIPNSVTSIGNHAFSGCSALASVTIPDSVTFIGNRAFEDCSILSNVTIPDSVTVIGESAFSDCPNLQQVSVSKGTRIDLYAFENYTQVIRR